ncbi:hypothetical protein LGH83_15485 [Lichenihabitans sp. PAMC28606]|uniref:hypothetical protein n=1 Tax=Lichenihabitans sp. PAMC28606 TaxID=2880932 RepID=UPI001D0A5391|nr:hypothetical protein [Lichenihabitans sp. PAMC28606]UDL93945.1 hypothetical protein LGH83_15485 [Lichenihabitans sp. PAMC28606]
MTDVRQVELNDTVLRTGPNDLTPAQGRDLRGAPSAGGPIAGVLKRARTGIKWRPYLMLLFYFAPTLVTGAYYGLIASDRYVSSAAFIVRTASKPSGSGGLNSLLRMAGMSRSDDDTYSVQNFLESRDAVKKLEEHLPLAEMYGRGADFISRYPSLMFGSTQEELYKYYTKMTSVVYSTATGVTSLEVQAFRPDDAQAIAVALLDLGEDLVNQLNANIHKDAVTTAEREVKRNEDRLTDAQVAVTAFQNKETMIDPVTSSVLVSTLVAKLQNDLAQTQAQISDMTAGSPNNPGLINLRRQADATRAQIDRERSRVSTVDGGLADKLGTYERLALEREFATKALALANSSLDTARAEVRRKQLYIERIVEPNLSDHATLPLRSWITFTVLCVNVLGVFIAWLVMSGVKEHVSSPH